MANKDDYLTCYREFFENFAKTVNPNDQLPVKLGSYKLINLEVIGGVIDWTTQYLTQKKCPPSLLAPLIQIVIDETRKSCKKQPTACGFNPSDNAYEPLKLMQTVMALTNDVCMRYLENTMLCSLPPPTTPPHNIVSVSAAKNKRRRMEDRHVVIQDLNTMFNIQEATPSSYYAIFDGHAGQDAACYSSAHLHQFLAESKHFAANPEQAFQDAFVKTDALFIDKCNVERLNSGTTAVCALLRPKEKILYVAWVGDSQALLVNRGRVLQCVEPHKPCREDEKDRIEKNGGCVCYWGTWRVNGQLAVSRAIGDVEYKPYVTAVPDIREIPLDGGEDFLILACDGLWDFVSEDAAATLVYKMIYENPDKTDVISERLVQKSKEQGSTDNISVIVVFLRDPSKIASDSHWVDLREGSPILSNKMEASVDNANFSNSNCPQKSDVLLNFSSDFKQNGDSQEAHRQEKDDFYTRSGDIEKTNGKRSAEEISEEDEDDDDLGPETDVDAVDDVKILAQEVFNNNPQGSFNPFLEKSEIETAQLELDLDLQKQQSSEYDGDRSPREETPTPPADSVLNVGGELLADSGEESEDEWNYIKGDSAPATTDNKENQNPAVSPVAEAGIREDFQPSEQIVEEREEDLQLQLELDDNMSQLNPNAAEFVPVSPTRTMASPVCLALFEQDKIIATSPCKPNLVESLITVEQFGEELKSRPKEFEKDDNAIEECPSHENTTEELLNKKNADDTVDLQSPSIKSVEELYFGPNASPFTPKINNTNADEESTLAVFGDSVMQDNSTFSEENIANACELGGGDEPVDLNKVQLLPDDLDDLINGTGEGINVEQVEQSKVEDVDLLCDFKQPIVESLHTFTNVIEENRSHDELLAAFDEASESVTEDNKADLMKDLNDLTGAINLDDTPTLLDTSAVCGLNSSVPNVIEDISLRDDSIYEVPIEQPDLIQSPVQKEVENDNSVQLLDDSVQLIEEETKVNAPIEITNEICPQIVASEPIKIEPVASPVIEEIHTETDPIQDEICALAASVGEAIEAITSPANEAPIVIQDSPVPVSEPVIAPISAAAVAATATVAVATAVAATKKITKPGAKPPQKPTSQLTKPAVPKQQLRPVSAKAPAVASKTNGEVKTKSTVTKKPTPVGTTITSKTTSKTSTISAITKTSSSTISSARNTTARITATTTSAPKPTQPRTTTTATKIAAKTSASTVSSAKSSTTHTSTTRTISAGVTNAAKPSTLTAKRVPPKTATSALSTSRGTTTTRNVSSATATNNVAKPAPLPRTGAPKTVTKSPQIAPRETKTSRQRTVKSPAEPSKTIAKTNGTTKGKPAVPSLAAANKSPLVNKSAMNAGGDESGANQNNFITSSPTSAGALI